jgi:hypothetical protein
MCLLSGFGLLKGVLLVRLLLAITSAIVFLANSALAISAFHPSIWLWWLIMMLVGFSAWSLFFAVAFWRDYVPGAEVR